MKPFMGNVGAGCNSNCILSVPAFVPHLFYFEAYRNAWITKSFRALFTHKDNWKHLSFVSLSYWFLHIPWLDSEVQLLTQLSLKWSIHCQWSWEGWDFPIDAHSLKPARKIRVFLYCMCVCVCVRMWRVIGRGGCRDRKQWENTHRHWDKQKAWDTDSKKLIKSCCFSVCVYLCVNTGC